MSATALRAMRTFWLVLLAGAANLLVLNLTGGTVTGTAAATACLMTSAAEVAYFHRRIGRLAAPLRGRPDYARIATLEMEIYGEAFHHDRAPAPREPMRPRR